MSGSYFVNKYIAIIYFVVHYSLFQFCMSVSFGWPGVESVSLSLKLMFVLIERINVGDLCAWEDAQHTFHRYTVEHFTPAIQRPFLEHFTPAIKRPFSLLYFYHITVCEDHIAGGILFLSRLSMRASVDPCVHPVNRTYTLSAKLLYCTSHSQPWRETHAYSIFVVPSHLVGHHRKVEGHVENFSAGILCSSTYKLLPAPLRALLQTVV